MRIAILDDEPEMASLLEQAAEALGYVGIGTSDPEEFIKLVDSGVEVAVLDLRMPRADGIEILRVLGSRGCRAEIILASGMDKKVLQVAEELATKMGLRTLGRLEKPFRISNLADLLARAGMSVMPVSPRLNLPLQVTVAQVEMAIRQKRVVPVYQLKVDLKSRSPVGCEVLMRLQDPQGGLVTPGQFIPVAEEKGLMTALTDLLVEAAFREFAEKAPADWSLSFNVAPSMLVELSLPDRLSRIAVAQGLSEERITVEITETGVVENQSLPLDILSRLRIKGFAVSIDDYGTGFSTLSHLRRFPATELKVDQMFVHDMLNNEASATLVRKTIELGHGLGLVVVAEGIETEGQQSELAAMGCDVGQGYLFSRPVALASIIAPADSLRADRP